MEIISPEVKRPDFLFGSGEMKERIRDFDWATTPLGPIDTWSPSLRTMVGILLSNRFPMLLWWGPSYIGVYNDAYIPILGSKHPKALGQPVRECWNEIWHILEPLIDSPFKGGPSTWMEDITLELNRNGFFEETHFTIAYSPVPDETVFNHIGGVLATVNEITEKVIGERRVNILREVAAHCTEAKTKEEACSLAAEIIAKHPEDIPFALFYLAGQENKIANLSGVAGILPGEPISPAVFELRDESVVLPYAKVLNTGRPELETRLPRILDQDSLSQPEDLVCVVPLPSNKSHHYEGVIVLGISPRLQFNESYRSFFELLTTQVATAVANAGAFEEERKRAAALEQIDQAKTAFFSNISHEFRTPLTLMLGPLEELMDQPGTNLSETDKQNLTTAHRNAMRLLKLVNSLLDFSRIEAGRQQANFSLVDMVTTTKNLAANFRSVVEKAGLDLIVKADSIIQPVYLDSEMWEKIVFNLLSNAFKYTLEGTITVELSCDPENAILKVIDTGVGIPENELPRMFERFHRVQNSAGRTYEGTGIGLSLVKELVRLHKGEITVESEAGKGSTFTVTIPFGKDHLAAFQSSVDRINAAIDDDLISNMYVGEASSLLEKEGERSENDILEEDDFPLIMVVDDNADMREHIRSLLAGRFSVISAANGLDALQKLREKRPALILSDIMMPIMDGIGLLKEVKSHKATAQIPVILLTARAGEESKIEGWQMGADDYLVKPFSSKELISRISSQIRTSNIRLQAQENLKNVIQQSPVAMALFKGEDFVIDIVNEKALEIWARNHRDVINRPLFEVFPELIGQGHKKILDDVYHTGKAFVAKEQQVALLRNGKSESGYYSFTYEPITSSKGEINSVLVVGIDITSETIARKKIEESEARKNNFIKMASHELKTPITSMKGYFQMLQERFRDSDDTTLQQSLGVIDRQISKLTRLISELLDVTRIESGRLTLDKTVFSLNQLVHEVTDENTSLLKKHRIAFEEMAGIDVFADQERIAQVLINLLTNAIKYSPAANEINVSLKKEGDKAIVSVQDFGIGIAAGEHKKIFENFYRVKGKDEQTFPGFGIGLYVVSEILKQHDGQVWVNSEKNKGSTFYFSLPLFRS